MISTVVAARNRAYTLRKVLPTVRPVLIRNERRLGRPSSRNRGAAAVSNDFILVCDDEYHEAGYARTCLDILLARKAGIGSGSAAWSTGLVSPGR